MRVLKWDAWVSMVIYTGATVAFYLLGAAVLNGKGLEVTNNDLIPTLSNLYQESFGSLGLWLFLVGALVVLYSTVFISTASNARLSADLWMLFTPLRFGVSKRPKCPGTSCLYPDSPALFYLLCFSGPAIDTGLHWCAGSGPHVAFSLLCGTLFSLCSNPSCAFSRKDLGPFAVDFKPAHDLRRVLSAV